MATAAVPADPSDLQRAAQDRHVATGGKLTPEGDAKRKKHPLDRFGEIAKRAGERKFPKGTDVFLAKYHGLFFVAPAQNSFTGVIVTPAETTPTCDAILRVFIASGNRGDRTKARLKYLLDEWGFERFLTAVESQLGRGLTRVPEAATSLAGPQLRDGHIGVHAQAQRGLSYIGIVLPVGRMTTSRMRGLAGIADRFGSGTIRLTVWQNLLLSDVLDARLPEALAAVEALGLATSASPLRAGLVACTGNAGCKFAASNTKGHAATLVDWLERRITVDQPINIHLTGCQNSCAQHYIADIGLLGVKVERGDDRVEGYDLHVGGGAGPLQAVGRRVRAGIVADELPPVILELLSAWRTWRAADEGFQVWSARQSDEALGAICDPVRAAA